MDDNCLCLCGGYLLYTGTSAPVNVIAGQTTDAGSIELKQTIPDLIIGRGIYLTKRPGDTQPLSPGTVFDGDSIAVNLDYRNTGPVAATGWRYELYLDSQLYRFGDESTSANESRVLVVPWVAVGGTHTFEWRLDTTNQVVEVDEANGTATLTVTILQKADLIAGRVFLTRPGEMDPLAPDALVEGDSVDVRLDFRNAGPVDATGWRYELYLDSQLYRSGNESISANESKVLVVPWVAIAGTHTVEFRLDTSNQVVELDKTNNTATLAITVLRKADLIAGRIFFTRPDEADPLEADAVVEGETVDVRLDVENRGPVGATGWRYEIYLDDQLYRSGDESLSANASKVLTVPWVAIAGTHTVEFRLDTNNQVKETDETNNILSMTFTVRVIQGIVAGERVDEVELGMERDEVTSLLGQPGEIGDDGSYTYVGLGLKLYFNDLAEVILIFVFPPYSGSTERGVKLGDSASTVAQKYGTDYLRTDDEGGVYRYGYTNLGIEFGFDQSDVCVFIDVYGPSASSKVTLPGAKLLGRRE
jgi:hypothetical protein